MKTIYKYQITITDIQFIEMPKGSKLLAFQSQNNNPCLWALVDLEQKTKLRKLYIIGTGNPIDEEIYTSKYVGTIQEHNGRLVWHLFDGGESQ